jgi:four helix bundle protein
MKKENLQERTLLFCVRMMRMIDSMPETLQTTVVAEQLIHSVAVVGPKYRAACRPRSARDFIIKMKIVEEHTDLILFWLELIEDMNIFPPEKIKDLKQEAGELLAIFVASLITARKNLKLKSKPEIEKEVTLS